MKSNDEISKKLKQNGLKFIHSICKDDNYLDKFLEAGGVDLIQNMLKYELKNNENLLDNNLHKNQYITNEPYNLKNASEADKLENINKEPEIVNECFKIINKIIKKKEDTSLDPSLFTNMVGLIE